MLHQRRRGPREPRAASRRSPAARSAPAARAGWRTARSRSRDPPSAARTAVAAFPAPGQRGAGRALAAPAPSTRRPVDPPRCRRRRAAGRPRSAALARAIASRKTPARPSPPRPLRSSGSDRTPGSSSAVVKPTSSAASRSQVRARRRAAAALRVGRCARPRFRRNPARASHGGNRARSYPAPIVPPLDITGQWRYCNLTMGYGGDLPGPIAFPRAVRSCRWFASASAPRATTPLWRGSARPFTTRWSRRCRFRPTTASRSTTVSRPHGSIADPRFRFRAARSGRGRGHPARDPDTTMKQAFYRRLVELA